MKKATSPSWFEEYKVPTSIIGTVIILLLLEYVFQFPSSLFRGEDTTQEPVIRVTHQLPVEDEKPLPSCSEQESLVCGKDGKTYTNACFAKVARIEVQKLGACDEASELLSDTGVIERSELLQDASVLSTEHDPSLLTNTGKYRVYVNEKIGYRLALPKSVFYQGFGAKDGAVHTIGVSLTQSGVENFDTSEVRVWYYKKAPKDISENLYTLSGGFLRVE